MLWNRNRNLLEKSEPELITVPEPEPDIKWCIWFPYFNIFFIQFLQQIWWNFKKNFPCKKAYNVARFSKKFFEKFAFYGLDSYGARTETVTCQKSEPELFISRNLYRIT